MAFVRHLQWGPQINFTYGPLGFLLNPELYYRSTSLLSLLFLVTEYSLTLSLVLYYLRRVIRLPWALLATYVIGITLFDLAPPETVLLGLCLLVTLFCADPSARNEWVRCACLGLLGAIGALVVTTVGIEAGLCLLVLSLTARERLKCLVIGLGLFAVTDGVLWPLVGGSYGDLGRYLHYSKAIVSGYPSAMGVNFAAPGEMWDFIICAVAILVIFVHAARIGVNRELLRIVLTSLIFIVLLADEGFIRADIPHQIRFFAVIPIVPLAVIAVDRFQPKYLLGVAVIILACWQSAAIIPAGLLSPAANVRNFTAQVYDDVSPSQSQAIQSGAMASLNAQYGIPASFILRIKNHTVAVEPWENTLVWSYQLSRWDPEPVLQAYSAYTAELDDLDVQFLASKTAPEWVLVSAPISLNGREPFWDPPAAQLALFCHYREVYASGAWEILRHVRDRCGQARLLKTVSMTPVTLYQTPTAPKNDIVVATFQGFGSSLSYRFANLLWKPPVTTINIQTAGVWGPVRFLAGTQSEAHVMVIPPSLAPPSPYEPWTITALQLGDPAASAGCTVRYYAIPYHA